MSPHATENDHSELSAWQNKYIYATLITRASYIPGVMLLAYSLHKTGTPHPLVVLYTDTLSPTSLAALQHEAPRTNMILLPIAHLHPPDDIKLQLIAARFADTWTKLRIFMEPFFYTYRRVIFLDADMLVLQNPDALFSTFLPPGPAPCTLGIAANHICVCNVDADPWAPGDWTVANCAYSAVSHPGALTHPPRTNPPAKPTYALLNSGMFVFEPSQHLATYITDFFEKNNTKLQTYKFPDQDFINDAFFGCWVAVGWQFNALKTMRYFHENIWRDNHTVILHYIVDKPWATRVTANGRAGYLGRDGVTHAWWWVVFENWKRQRIETGMTEALEAVEEQCGPRDGEDLQQISQDLKDIGSEAQNLNNSSSE